MLAGGIRVTSRLDIPQSDEQVSRIGMSRPHPSLERHENGSFRLITTIRVDHTKFSQVALKQQQQLIQVLRRLDLLCQVISLSFLNPFEFRKPKTGCQNTFFQ